MVLGRFLVIVSSRGLRSAELLGAEDSTRVLGPRRRLGGQLWTRGSHQGEVQGGALGWRFLKLEKVEFRLVLKPFQDLFWMNNMI